MNTNLSDRDNLAGYIVELQNLYDVWVEKTDIPVDIGECGGQMITQIEAMGQAVLDMRTAFVTLLSQTISYMEESKEGLEDINAQATKAIQAE